MDVGLKPTLHVKSLLKLKPKKRFKDGLLSLSQIMNTSTYITKGLGIKELTQNFYVDKNSHNCIHSAAHLQKNIIYIYGVTNVKGNLYQIKYLGFLRE